MRLRWSIDAIYILLRGYGDVVGQLVDQTGQPLTFDLNLL